WRRFWAFRDPAQVHPRFSRRPPAFPAVTADAARDDVPPVLPAAMSDRQDMIEGKLTRREVLAAVLAPMVVSRVDVRPGKRHVIEPALDLDVPQKADARRQLEAERNRPDLPVVDGNDLDLALAPKRNGLLPVDNLERFV